MPRLLESWLTSYLELVNETEPPQRFHLWTGITVIGALLGRKCTVSLGPETFFPNLYTVLIGPPGVRKGTAIKYCTDLLDEVAGRTNAPDAVTKEQLCMEMQNNLASTPINGEMFIHSSLFVIAPELVVFIKENDHERLGYLCQLYDGLKRFEYKTKTQPNAYIVNPGLWLLGATTPNWIEIAMKQLGVGGGMTSRTIFVFANKKGRHISATKMKPFDPLLRSKLISDLAEIERMAGEFRFTPEAKGVYDAWYEGRYLETGIDDSRFASYWERLPGMVIKVAMIVSASKREDMQIIGNDVLQSIKMFENIAVEMPQAFGGLGQNTLGSQTEMIRNILREKGAATKSYIMRTLRMHLSEWDYQRCRNSLLGEKFCDRMYSQEEGEEMLVITKRQAIIIEGGEDETV